MLTYFPDIPTPPAPPAPDEDGVQICVAADDVQFK